MNCTRLSAYVVVLGRRSGQLDSPHRAAVGRVASHGSGPCLPSSRALPSPALSHISPHTQPPSVWLCYPSSPAKGRNTINNTYLHLNSDWRVDFIRTTGNMNILMSWVCYENNSCIVTLQLNSICNLSHNNRTHVFNSKWSDGDGTTYTKI